MRSAKARLLLCWALALLCAAGGFAGCISLSAHLINAGRADLMALYGLNALQQALTFALPALLILQARPERWRRFRASCRSLKLHTAACGLLLAVSGTVVVSVIASLWASWLHSATGYAGDGTPLPAVRSVPEGFFALLFVAIVPALCEELLFRALIQGGLCRRLPRAGIWIAALIFGVAHLRWEALPALVLVGAALGYIYRRHGYFASALIHGLYNAVVLILSARQVSVTLGAMATCCLACVLALRWLFKGGRSDETDGTGL